MPMRCLCTGPLLALLALAAAGCGDDGGDGDGPLTVAAAASLADAFEAYGDALPGEQRFSFAGSDELAAQIRQGAAPDVYAAANTAFPEALAADGLVERPVAFARNELVVAVPTGSAIESVEDLAAPGLDLVIGADGVPVGDYARELLARLPHAQREAILANVRSQEPDVKGIVGKVAQGAADAGFVYASDVAAAPGDLVAVSLPARLRPDVAYGIAVVKGAADAEAARAFVDGLLGGAGRRALEQAGFLPPPGG